MNVVLADAKLKKKAADFMIPFKAHEIPRLPVPIRAPPVTWAPQRTA